jgi:poly-gamma-glutamate synthesis protein (capsule biosynthesis protein)
MIYLKNVCSMKQLLSAVLFLRFIVFAENDASAQISDTVFLLFAGDVMQHKTQIDAVSKADGTYDYEPCFRLVKNEIASADLAVANLEVPLAGKPYSGYPQFSAPDAVALALKDIGFDVLLTANNHSCDRGMKGAQRTIAMLDSFDIKHTGMFLDTKERERRYPLLLSVGSVKIALLNYTYGTNGIPVHKPFVVNIIDTAVIMKDIEAAKSHSPDLIVACMHWGEEYSLKPGREQERLTEMFFDAGVNLVIGAHPHVIQPMEKRYDGNGRCTKLAAYSLGNFVSNQPFPNTDGGAMLKIRMIKDTLGIRIDRAGYALLWVYRPKENGRTRHYLLPAADYENDVELLGEQHRQQIRTFVGNMRRMLNRENVGIGEFRIRRF